MDSDDLFVDPDIRRASTLAGRVYRDPEIYHLQRQRVFARAWHLVGDAHQLKAPGHVIPTTLLPGCLDEPIVLSRDQEGTFHCFSNVCTHRAALVVEGEGHCASLRCRYHGRRFELDGRFRSMPEFDDVEGFPSEADDLPKLATAQWGPFLFASLDPAMPFEEWIGPVEERMGGWYPLGGLTFDPDTAHDYLIPANWALYCDNYLEEFHIPYVHGQSLTTLDYDAYRTEVFQYANLQFGVGSAGERTFQLPEGHPDQDERMVAYYFWLFPNLTLNFYPWGISVNVIQPLSHERTRVSFLPYVHHPELRGEGAGGDLHRVEMEDEEVVESVQRGVQSRLYHRGRYSPRREVGVHHFHRLLTRFMGDGSDGRMAGEPDRS